MRVYCSVPHQPCLTNGSGIQCVFTDKRHGEQAGGKMTLLEHPEVFYLQLSNIILIRSRNDGSFYLE